MPFDAQRIALLVGLFVMGYWILLTWDQDYGQAQTPPAVAGDEREQSRTSQVERPPSGASDVPAVAVLPEKELPTTEAASMADWLSVQTPLYNLWIDPHGGDVVRVDLKQYPVSLDEPDHPITLLDRNQARTYVAQSGLRSDSGPDRPSSRALYQSDQHSWVMSNDQNVLEVPLRWSPEDGGLSVWKIYRLYKDKHQVAVRFEVSNTGQTAWHGRLFAQITHDGRPSPLVSGGGLGPVPYQGAAFTTDEDRYLKLDFDDLDEESFRADVQRGWAAVLQHYFLAAWVPEGDETYYYYGHKLAGGNYQVGLIGPEINLLPGAQTTTAAAILYIGPKIQSDLASLANHLDLAVDYGFLWWLAQPLFWLMKQLHALVNNWGLAIILLTFIVKLVLYPLSAAAYRSMANMRRMAPEMKRLQSLHEGDRQKLQQGMMELYRREKINPLGGCFPILLQMPVFLALYWVLYESVELRHAPFVFWIQDLAAKDPYFILPILMGITMYLQQLLNPPIPDPVQARVLKMMPIIFTVFFLFFPSGLVLYWLVNNVLSIAQQYWINRRLNTN